MSKTMSEKSLFPLWSVPCSFDVRMRFGLDGLITYLPYHTAEVEGREIVNLLLFSC